MLNNVDSQYHDLLQQLVDKIGTERMDRTGTGTVSIFGDQMRFNLAEQFPILTTKNVHFKSVAAELNWFLRGDTNIQYLLERKVHIWTDWRLKEFNKLRKEMNKREVSAQEFEEYVRTDNEFAKSWGDIGKGYGHQWRNFGALDVDDLDVATDSDNYTVKEGFDQIAWVINEIKTNPTSRRLIVSGWNPQEIDQVDLPPCHTLFQFFVEPMSFDERKRWVDANYAGGGLQAITDHRKANPHKYPVPSSKDAYRESHLDVLDFVNAPKAKLSCQLYQRSADIFLGVPFNIASYALLTHIIAQECGLAVGDFVWTGGDVHLYSNHYEQAKIQLSRESTDCKPQLIIPHPKAFDEYEWDDFLLSSYYPHPPIKAPVAV